MLNTEQFAQDYERLHASYERQAYVIIKRALDAQKRAVIDYVQKSEHNIILLPIVLPSLIDSKLTEAAYLDIYTTIGIRHARNYSRLLDRLINGKKGHVSNLEQKAIGFSSEFWRRIMADFFRTESSGKITEVDDKTKDRIRKILEEAQLQNMSTFQQARYLVSKLSRPDFNKNRGMLIARTESTIGANVAANRVAEEAEFKLLKGWSAGRDGRTRTSHRIVGNKPPIPMESLFEVPSPSGVGIEYTKHPGGAGLSIGNLANCFLPDQLTGVSEGVIKKAFRNRYIGKVVTIQTASGNKFTCTPNHPILTGNGWVKAGLLTESDYLIKSNILNDSFLKLQVKDVKSSFEQVFNSLAVVGVRMSMSGLLVNFYGDIPAGDVDIINTTSQLRNSFKPSFIEVLNQIRFKATDYGKRFLLSLGLLNFSIGKVFRSKVSNSLMSFGRVSKPFFRGGVSHSSIHALASVPLSDAVGVKQTYNRSPLAPVFFSNSLNTPVGIIKRKYFRVFNSFKTAFGLASSSVRLKCFKLGFRHFAKSEFLSFCIVSGLDSLFLQDSDNGFSTTAETFSDFIIGGTGNVESDNVVNLSWSEYAGHVYTFETDTQMYDINGYVARNCRCAVYHVPALDEDGLPIPK